MWIWSTPRLKTAVFRNVPRFPIPAETSDHKLVFQPLGNIVDVNFQLRQRECRLCKAQASKFKKNLRWYNHIHFLNEVLNCTVSQSKEDKLYMYMHRIQCYAELRGWRAWRQTVSWLSTEWHMTTSWSDKHEGHLVSRLHVGSSAV